jgi:putative transposase
LPRLGRLRLKERGYLPTTVHVLSATVSERAGRWYVAIVVEAERHAPVNTGPVVGVDLGVKTLATLSDGATVANPRHLRSALKKLKRLQRAVSRKRKGSASRRKAARRLGNLYRTVANQRANTLHQLTSRLAKTKSVVVIEDLNVAGMLKNHHLAQAISDVGFGEFRRQLTYKASWYGCQVIIASRWEPSSKTCSGCGWVDEALQLGDRTFHCLNPYCRQVLDRDLNAARNLVQLAGSSTERQNACGEGSAGWNPEIPVKLSSLKQEPDTPDPAG